jgi:tetratricopeptide (TPR) repeat protein
MSRRARSPISNPARPVQASPEPQGWTALAVLALILLATCYVYSPALRGAPLWDDDAHLTRPELQSFVGLARIWIEPAATQQYYPLLHSAFWLEHRMWGDSTFGYHAVTLAWHLLAVVLLYSILRKLRVPGALLAAALFALHPVMVESVAWISEQKNTLSAVFYLAAMRVYLEFDQSRRRSPYVAALLLFILGLLTKTVVATLPAALLVIFWWQRGAIDWRRDVLPLAPFFALGAVGGALTAYVEYALIGAQGATHEMPLIDRVLMAGRVVWFYLSKLVWPADLVFIYPRWQIDASAWWQWLFVAATLAMFVVLWSWRRRSRGPLAAWLLFVGTLVPVLGFLNVYPFIFSLVADHFQYLASIAVFTLVAATIATGLSRLKPASCAIGIAACVLLVGALGGLTRHQSRLYVDNVTLFEHTVARNPASWMAQYNLGMALMLQGKRPDAITHFQESLRIRPDYYEARNNLALAYVEAGQVQQGIDEYHEAIRQHPDSWEAYFNLGNALLRLGNTTESLAEYAAALARRPADPTILNQMAVALMALNRDSEAEEKLRQALEIDPGNVECLNSLGLCFVKVGKMSQAIEQFEQALKNSPDDVSAHNNLGTLFANTDDTANAVAHFQEAVRLSPNTPHLRSNLGNALLKCGRSQEAVEHFRAAVRIEPDNLQAAANLVQALAQAGHVKEAVATAEHTITAARSAGSEAAANQLEEWLHHYRLELERGNELNTQPNAAEPPAVLQTESARP